MPKLPTAAAQAAKKAAESSGFAPLPADTYEARLTSVTAKNAKSSGNPMWVWELEVVTEGFRGRRLWVNTVLTDNAMWKLAEMFNAFGADTDTDTDELIGDHCYVDVVQRTIDAGARAGQIGNDVARAYPLEGVVGNEEAVAAGIASGGGSSDGAADDAGESPW